MAPVAYKAIEAFLTVDGFVGRKGLANLLGQAPLTATKHIEDYKVGNTDLVYDTKLRGYCGSASEKQSVQAAGAYLDACRLVFGS